MVVMEYSGNNVNVFLAQMFLSIGFAALGVAGAVYSMAVAALGLSNGPVCRFGSGLGEWGRPFGEYENYYQFNVKTKSHI